MDAKLWKRAKKENIETHSISISTPGKTSSESVGSVVLPVESNF